MFVNSCYSVNYTNKVISLFEEAEKKKPWSITGPRAVERVMAPDGNHIDGVVKAIEWCQGLISLLFQIRVLGLRGRPCITDFIYICILTSY